MALTTDTATFDAVHDMWEDVQRVRQMLARLLERAGIDPAEAARLPGEAVPEGARAA